MSSKTVTISNADSSLSGVRDAINRAEIGVSAAVVNDGTGYRLVMTSDATGAENSFEITVGDTGDSNNTDNLGLSRLAFNSAVGLPSEQIVAAAGRRVDGKWFSAVERHQPFRRADGLTLTLKENHHRRLTVTGSRSRPPSPRLWLAITL